MSINIGSYKKYAQICSYDRLDSQTLCEQSPSERYFCIGCYPKFGYHQFPLKLEMDMQQGFKCKSLGRRQIGDLVVIEPLIENLLQTCHKSVLFGEHIGTELSAPKTFKERYHHLLGERIHHLLSGIWLYVLTVARSCFGSPWKIRRRRVSVLCAQIKRVSSSVDWQASSMMATTGFLASLSLLSAALERLVINPQVFRIVSTIKLSSSILYAFFSTSVLSLLESRFFNAARKPAWGFLD